MQILLVKVSTKEMFWVVTLHAAFCDRVCEPSRIEEEKEMLRIFIRPLMKEMVRTAEKKIYEGNNKN
jgi:hypothetical protein